MSENMIPPMEPLAPIIDQMRELAREEIPTPRSCKVRLWDDGTFDLVIYHSMGDSERQAVRYERSTACTVRSPRRAADGSMGVGIRQFVHRRMDAVYL